MNKIILEAKKSFSKQKRAIIAGLIGIGVPCDTICIHLVQIQKEMYVQYSGCIKKHKNNTRIYKGSGIDDMILLSDLMKINRSLFEKMRNI